METDESPVPLRPAPDTSVKESPFHPRNLFDLLFRPRRFFERLNMIQHNPYVFLSAWIWGMVAVTNRFDRLNLEGENNTRIEFWGQVASSWLTFWAFIAVAGVVFAFVVWCIGGWWYRLRIQWSGDLAPEPFVVRQVFFYSGLIVAFPIFLLSLVNTFVYHDYLSSRVATHPAILVMLILPFWGVMIGYVGVRTCFNTSKWQALLWIAVLPCLQYAIGIVGLVISSGVFM